MVSDLYKGATCQLIVQLLGGSVDGESFSVDVSKPQVLFSLQHLTLHSAQLSLRSIRMYISNVKRWVEEQWATGEYTV